MRADVIREVEVLVSSPDRNYVTVRITTAEGLTGLGDATLNGRELAVVSWLRDHLQPMLLGRDPSAIEDTWQLLYRSAYWRQGAVGMAALAGVDTALWDIKAKRAGMPLYQLLGGASRVGCLSYAHAFGTDVPSLVDSASARIAEGYQAVRLQLSVPGLGPGYGVTGAPGAYEPAGRTDRPVEEVWSTPEYLRSLPGALLSVRDEVGPEVHLLHDVHHRLTPAEAGRLAQDLEPVRLFWLEDPVPTDDPESFRQIRLRSSTPLATGEVFTHLEDARLLLQGRLIDYLRAAVTHAGGLTHLRRMMDFAAAFDVRSACHGPSDISPVGLATALHLGLSIPNFGIQEHMGHSDTTDAVFPHAYRLDDGLLHPGEAPGHGVGFDDELAAQHPYQRAYLPVNRLRDGTVHPW